MICHDRVSEYEAMPEPREKFATQVDSSLLAAVRDLARYEGRQIQALVEEALADLVEKRRNARARPHVLAAYRGSLERFGALYKKLAE